ncbi:MAG: hypothetical protein RL199_507 [Pseudomonadota bacterium]|jgi:hypothetical protein
MVDRPDDLLDEDLPPEEASPSTGPLPGVGDFVRRALLAGVGAVFMTEEQIRKGVQELKLPKEAIGYVVGQAEKTRQEASRVLRHELRRFLDSDSFRQQLTDFFSGITLEIKAEVRLKPGEKPSVESSSVKLRAADDSKS